MAFPVASDQDVENFSHAMGKRLWAAIDAAIRQKCDEEGKPITIKLSLTNEHFNILARLLLTIIDCPEEPNAVLLSVMSWAIMSIPMDSLSEADFISEVARSWRYREKLNAPKKVSNVGSN
jgi:hypothetical protein